MASKILLAPYKLQVMHELTNAMQIDVNTPSNKTLVTSFINTFKLVCNDYPKVMVVVDREVIVQR